MSLKKVVITIFFIIIFISLFLIPVFNIFQTNDLTELVISKHNKTLSSTQNENDLAYIIDDKFFHKKSDILKEQTELAKWLNLKEGKKGQINNFFLDNTLNQSLILNQVIEEELLNNQDLQTLLWMSIKDTIVKYYIKSKIAKEKPGLFKVTITQNEFNLVYNRMKDSYKALGFNEKEIKELINTTIKKEKQAALLKRYESQILNKLKLKHKILIK